MPERPRILQMGPDPRIGGGMAAALRALLESPLRDDYDFDLDPTYRGAAPLARLGVFGLSLLRLAAWSVRGRGRIVHVHATVRGSAYRKAICVAVAKALGRRVVLHFHSGAGDIAAFAAALRPPVLGLLRSAFRRADRVLAVSAASAQAIERAYGLDEIEVVPNPAPAIAPFERPAAADGTLTALYLGGFANPAKGGDVLLAALVPALEASPGLELVLAGPGELPAEGSAELSGRRARWAGWLDPGAKDALMREARVLVLPSRSEGLPMALLEGMAYGLAIVATAVGGIPEVAEDGVDALLVAPEDPEALAHAIGRLAADPELRSRLGAAARTTAGRLDVDQVAGRLRGVYGSLS